MIALLALGELDIACFWLAVTGLTLLVAVPREA